MQSSLVGAMEKATSLALAHMFRVPWRSLLLDVVDVAGAVEVSLLD